MSGARNAIFVHGLGRDPPPTVISISAHASTADDLTV
jgi:hypothetical protein